MRYNAIQNFDYSVWDIIIIQTSGKFFEISRMVKQRENIETFTIQTNNLADYKENKLLSKDERK